MPSDESLPLAVGELRRKGVSLYTREATALTAEVCRHVFNADLTWAPDADHVLLKPDGSVLVRAPHAPPNAELMVQLATLLESLLPPLGSAEPEFAVRASLRLLGPRARNRPGLAPILAPESLAAELEHFTTEPPADVLRSLWRRADRALHQYLPQPASTERVQAAAVRSLADATTEAVQLDDAAQAREASAITRGRSHPRGFALGIAVSLACAIGFGGGEWLGRHSYATMSHGRAPIDPSHSEKQAGASVPLRRSPGAGRQATAHQAASRLSDESAFTPAPVEVPGLIGPAFSPSFTEDGREIIFHVGREPVAQIANARLEPGGRTDRLVMLSHDRSRTYHARRSPDGQLVAFDSDRDGERAVYVGTRDWSRVTKVSGVGFAALPSWSPNMRWLAIVRAEPKQSRVWNLWLRDVKSGALARLTQYRLGQTWSASWFPDSQLVCYSHEDRLVILDIRTRAARVFASPKRGHLVRTPAVSPDGTRIIFQVYNDGAWLLDLTNGSMRRVLDDATAEEFAWNPQATHVAYHSRRDGRWRLWMMGVPGA